MGRDKKGKASSKPLSGGMSSGYGHGHGHGNAFEQNDQEEQVPYGYDDDAAVPRFGGHVADDFYGAMDTDQGQSSPQEFNPNYTTNNAHAYGGEDYAQQQGYAAQEAQQDQWQGQQPDSVGSALAQPPTSSRSGTHRSHSSRDTSMHGHYGQHRDRRHYRGSGTEPPLAEQAFAEMAEQQQSSGMDSFSVPYADEANYTVPYQEGSAANPFAEYGNSPHDGNQMQYGNFTALRAYGNSVPPHHHAPGFENEAANRGYGIYDSDKFRVGRVLRIQWPEPHGYNERSAPVTDTQSVRKNDVFSKNRRFVILKSYTGHSVCAPILTYGNRACTKRGVKPEHHGIIYSTERPYMLPGEPDLEYPPVAMVPYHPTEALRKESRVNYSKRYTVEHNVLVSFVGEVRPEDLHVILNA